MATFLDVGLLDNFGVIFVILIVFLILFGLLEYIKAFGPDKRGLHGIIALVVALLFLVSKIATNMVKMMVPWFMVIGIFLFFSMFLIRMFGRTEADMRSLVADPNFYPWLIIFVILILILSLGNAFGQSLLEKGEGETVPINGSIDGQGYQLQPATEGTTSTTTTSFSTNLLNTLRHPKVLGMLFIFIVGMIALIFLTKRA